MDSNKLSVLRALYRLEEPLLNATNRTSLANIWHSATEIGEIARQIDHELDQEKVVYLLDELWRDAQLLSATSVNNVDLTEREAPSVLPISPFDQPDEGQYVLKGEITFSDAHGRNVDVSNPEDRRYRSRVAESLRMLAFNRQRFGDLLPSSSSFAYKLQERRRPKRNVHIDDAIAEIKNGNPANASLCEAIEISLQALGATIGKHIAEFQIEATRAALFPDKHTEALALLAGVSSGKTIAFALPSVILAVQRSLDSSAGVVRSLFVYPRATLVEDQFQRLETWTENINRIAGKRLLHGPALDAAGKLPHQVYPDPSSRTSVIQALKLAFSEPGKCFEFVLTTTETLKRRLQNPYSFGPYIRDLDTVVLDEAHLLEGLQGAHAGQMFRRIDAARKLLGVPPIPLKIAASATMADPDAHVGKLFGLPREKVKCIIPTEETEEIFGAFHHIFVRSVAGTPLLSAITNGASCLIHNRSDGLINQYYRPGTFQSHGARMDFTTESLHPTKEIKKTIAFVDSLSTIGSWNFTLRDNEFSLADQQHMGEFQRRQDRRYPYFTWFNEPLWRIPARQGHDELASKLRPICEECKAGRSLDIPPQIVEQNLEILTNVQYGPRSSNRLPFSLTDDRKSFGTLEKCPYFNEGMCWWFSKDDETQVPWISSDLYGASAAEKSQHSVDANRYLTFGGQIRSMPITSHVGLDEDELLADVNDLFQQPADQVFQVRESPIRRRIHGNFGGEAPERTKPWKENFSLLMASPKIEVGVDFDNVRDGILFRAIRNVASYQQKAGRVGRESNSDSVIVTFMTQTPTDFHYYRNPTKLAAPGYLDPVPLKPDNPDVLCCHLYLSCFDFVASKNSELMLVRGPGQLTENGHPDAVDFDKSVAKLVATFPDWRTELKGHLQNLAPNVDDTIVDEAIEKFERLLGILNYPAANLNQAHPASWSFASLIQRRQPVAAGGELEELRKWHSDMRDRLRDCERSYVEARHGDYSVSIFRQLEQAILNADEVGFAAQLKIAMELYPKIAGRAVDIDAPSEDQVYFQNSMQFISQASNFSKKLDKFGRERQYALAFLTIATEFDSRLANAREARRVIPDFYYLDGILTKFSYFVRQYPYVMPQTFFDHPKSEKVLVSFSDRTGSQEYLPRPTALFDLLPGTWTYRFGRPLKSPSGRIDVQPHNNIGYINLNSAENNGFRTTSLTLPVDADELPEDFPALLRNARKEIDIRAPLEVSLIPARDQVLVNRARALVADDDENERRESDQDAETSERGASRTQTIPRTSPRSWYRIDYEEASTNPIEAARTHPVPAALFERVSESSSLRVTRYAYGLNRSYGSDVTPPPFFFVQDGNRPVCIGDQIITDGIVLQVDRNLVDRVIDRSVGADSPVLSSQIRHALAGFLAKECGASLFTATRVRQAIITAAVKGTKHLSLQISDIQNAASNLNDHQFEAQIEECELAKFFGSPAEERVAAKERAARYVDESLEVFREFTSRISEFGIDFVARWTRDTLVHTLALKCYQSAVLAAGAGSDQLGYFYKSAKSEDERDYIYLFDYVESGSGLTDLIAKHFFIDEKRRIDGEFVASTDFVTQFLGSMGSCPSHMAMTVCNEKRDQDSPPVLGASARKLISSDVNHSFDSLHTNRVLRWLANLEDFKYQPDRLDEARIAIDASACLIPLAVRDNLIDEVDAMNKFERALAGCISSCPECVDDQENSIFGAYLNGDHVDNRLTSMLLEVGTESMGDKVVKIATAEDEISTGRLGVASESIRRVVADVTADELVDDGGTLTFKHRLIFDV